MLESITIKNFKKIREDGITLSKLGRVNYLVGENGCGKSSVLSALIGCIKYKKENTEIILQPSNIIFTILKIDLADRYVEHNNNVTLVGMVNGVSNRNNELKEKIYKIFYGDDICRIIKEIKYKLRNGPISDEDYLLLPDTLKNEVSKEEFEELIINSDDIDVGLKQQPSGIKSFVKLYSQIKNSNSQYIVIEEPDVFLHPKIIKKIASMLNEFQDKQFFISTHSPFIISAAAEFLDHKVYLIEDGQTRDLKGNLGNGQNGYSGNHALSVASKMLGAGIEDITSPTSTVEQMNIIYCEGEGEESKDSIFYNIIFPEINGVKNIFLSCRGANSIVTSYYKAKDSIGHILGNRSTTNVFGFIDRSCGGSGSGLNVGDGKYIKTNGENTFSDDDVKMFNIRHEGENLRVLGRREIENYLFDKNVLLKLDPTLLFPLDYEAEFELQNIKDKVGKMPFLEKIIQHYGGIEKFMKILAQKIYDNKSDGGSIQILYEELENCIFGINEENVSSHPSSLSILPHH